MAHGPDMVRQSNFEPLFAHLWSIDRLSILHQSVTCHIRKHNDVPRVITECFSSSLSYSCWVLTSATGRKNCSRASWQEKSLISRFFFFLLLFQPQMGVTFKLI